MSRALPILLVVASLALSGCTFLGGDDDGTAEAREDPFRGPALHLVVANDNPYVYTATFRVLGPHDDVLDERTFHIGPNGTSEEWKLPIEQHGAHQVEMSYNWTHGGAAASGSDEQVLDTTGCDGLTRGTWRMLHASSTAVRFEGSECVS